MKLKSHKSRPVINRRTVRRATRKCVAGATISEATTIVAKRLGAEHPCYRRKIEELLNELFESRDVEFRDGKMHPLSGTFKAEAIKHDMEKSRREEVARRTRGRKNGRHRSVMPEYVFVPTGEPTIDSELQARNWWDDIADASTPDPVAAWLESPEDSMPTYPSEEHVLRDIAAREEQFSIVDGGGMRA